MKLTDQITDFVNAAFTGLWILTSEPDEAEREIAQHARQKNWQIAVWDVASGLRLPGNANGAQPESGAGDPLAALRSLPALANDKGTANRTSGQRAKADEKGTGMLILHNFHRFLNNPDVIQTVFTQLVAGKRQRTFIVVLAPTVALPAELEKMFVVLEHALPDRQQLEGIARELTSEDPNDMPKGEDLQRVLDAAAGLTRYEAEGSFALSLTRKNAIRPEVIWELKSQTLRKNNLLTLHRGHEDFNSLGGLNNLKDFCRRALKPNKVKPRGVLLLGPSGTGKSQFCKALGNETGRPTLLLDIGSLMGSLVGQSEGNLRQALRIADAMSPAILFCDELEKALSGVGSSGDSGVSTRLFGNLLTWLSDHESDVFFVGTSNDISKLPPEFTRAERFDGVFFLDLPHAGERAAIWTLYREQYGIPKEQTYPNDASWTGAEVKACCRLAALLDVTLHQAAQNIVPVAVTAAESVEKLRTWASGRCLCATNPGAFSREGAPEPKVARRINRSSDN